MKYIFRFLYLALLATLFIGCKLNNETVQKKVSINTFNLKAEALNKGDSLKLIYASSLDDRNEPIQYLIQVVVVRLKTNDTINILCSHTDHINETDGDKIFYFEPMDEFTRGLVTSSDSIIQKMLSGDSLSIATWSQSEMMMVAQDQRFIEFNNARYPTILGEIK